MHRLQRPLDPPEYLVHDEALPCPYLPRETARFPMRLPSRPLQSHEMARRLEAGDRRQGVLLYRPNCPTCRACEPIRIDVEEFRPGRTQRRIFRRGRAELRTEIGRPATSREKVALYNRHKIERGLLLSGELLEADGYEQFLVDTCTDTIELCFRAGGKLAALAVADRADGALSAVYCYFDPAYSELSPGTYAILEQIALCREWGLRHLYLGLYVARCRALSYKASFYPHERLIDGAWQRFERRP